MIAPLAYNGGPTSTHALLAGSIAIDKGHVSGTTSDQRGYLRTVDLSGIPNTPGGDGTDIGSYEYVSAPLLSVSIGGRVTDAAGMPIAKAYVILTDGGGNSRRAFTNPFGYYRFDSVGAFEGYIVSVQRKGYLFNPRFISPNTSVTDFDFMAAP